MFLSIDKKSYYLEDLSNFYVKFKPNSGQNLQLFDFLKFWFKEKYKFKISTSGSTGLPKNIKLSKFALLESAKQTIDFLNLEKENIYCCISIEKIGGLMMIVRALTGNYDITITNPVADPMEELDINHKFTFVSLVPYQLNSIINNSESFAKLNRFRTILVGGAEINKDILEKVERLKPNIYHTFGMTETCSNFALKKLNNGKWNYFKPFPDVLLKLDKNGVLSVKGKQTENKWIKTNDIVKIYSDGFEFIGRNDFIINTGGFKVSPEYIELKISEIINPLNKNSVFYISSKSDKNWGEILVLVHHCKDIFENPDILSVLKSKLEKYEMPKKFVFIGDFPLNQSLKIDRKKLKDIISNLL